MNPLQRLRQRYRSRILIMFSGDPEGEPEWVRKISEGDDVGYFGADSAVWHVNGGVPVIAAGVGALLMQTLHPGAMAGVHDHSRYASDPLGRLSGTVRWVVTTTFGATNTVQGESQRVSRLHDRVNGQYEPGAKPQESIAYSAHDEDLVGWVHTIFTDAFLRAHRTWGDAIPEGPHGESGEDRYVREWAIAGRQMGMTNPPESVAELAEALRNYRPFLRRDDKVSEALTFLVNPPLPFGTGIPYRILVAGAISTFDKDIRDLLGLKRPWWPAITFTRWLLGLMGLVLGGDSTSRIRALERIARLEKAAG